MLRALAWKEYRQQRAILIIGLALTFAMPLFVIALQFVEEGMRLENLNEVVLSLPVVFLAVLWPFLALVASSTTIANEHEERTLRFLLSRPVSRGRVWATKTAVAAGAVTIVAACSLPVLWMTNRMVPAEAAAPSLSAMMQSARVTSLSPLALVSVTALLFACGVLCSTLLTRPLTAAAAALALAMTVGAVISLVWARLSLSPQFEPLWFASELLIVSGGLLLVSLMAFARSDFFSGNAAGRKIRGAGPTLVAGVTALGIAALALPLVYAAASPRAEDVVLSAEAVAMNGAYVATTGTTENGDTTQAWLMNGDGTGLRPLAGRHTMTPLFVTGSDWVLYKSRRRFAAASPDIVDLRLVHARTAEDRLVLPDAPARARLFFGGNAGNLLQGDDRVAFVDSGRLTVARIDGRGSETYDVAATPLDGAFVLGFNDNDVEEVVYLHAAGGTRPLEIGDGAATLSVYRPSTGETRVLRELTGGWMLPRLSWAEDAPAQWSPRSGWVYVPVITGHKLELVDAVSGEARTLHEFAKRDVADDAGAERCHGIRMGGRRTWPGGDGSVVREDQILFGDCTATARAQAIEILATPRAAAGTMSDAGAPTGEPPPPAGLLRAVGLDTGDERVWPLPQFEGEIRFAWLRPGTQDQVLLDIRSGDGEAFAMVVALDGSMRSYARGWRARGWIGLAVVRLQGELDGGVALAVGDMQGRVRPVYPRQVDER